MGKMMKVMKLSQLRQFLFDLSFKLSLCPTKWFKLMLYLYILILGYGCEICLHKLIML